jgi:hypothetical protein
MVLRPRGPLVLGEKENRIMNATKVTKATWEQRIRGLVAGTQKHSPNGSLTLGGATYTATALVQLLQSLADALGAVDSAKASWQDALKNATDVRATVGPVVQVYRSWLVATYGNAPATLADYDVTPPKARTPLTVEQKVAKAAKAKATRTARNTMGTKQKKSVKGTVPTTAPTTPSTPSQPVAPGPVASAPSQGTSGGSTPRVP